MSSRYIMAKYLWLFLVLAVATFIVLEAIGTHQYVIDIYNIQKNQTTPPKPEMIVVLAGGLGRIEAAYELMKGYDVPLLFIAGTYNKLNFDALAKKYKWDNTYKDRIKIDNVSTSTLENARISYQFAMQNNIKNIVLVTSIYHMQRAVFLFNKVYANTGVGIIPYGTYVNPIDMKSWWKDPKTLKSVFVEYIKFQYYRMIFSER